MSRDAQRAPPATTGHPAVEWIFRWVEHIGTPLAPRGNRLVSVHLVGVASDSLVTIKEVEHGSPQAAQEALAQSQMLKLKSLKRPKLGQWPLCDYADVQQVQNKKFIVSKYYPCMSLESLFPLFPSPLSSSASNNNNNNGASPSGTQSRFTRFVPSLAKSILHDVLRGLNELHRAGLAHGNLRPSSVLVTCCLHAKLDNIGFMSTESPLSDPLLWIWCAPEITDQDFPAAGQTFAPLALSLTESEWLERCQRADVFSFGLLVYFLLSGLRPFHQLLMSAAGDLRDFSSPVGTEPLEFRLRGCRSRWHDFVRVGLEVLCNSSDYLSAELKQLALRCLACDPLHRPTTTELLLDEGRYFSEREERVAEFAPRGTTGKEIVVPRPPRVGQSPPTSPTSESISGTEYSQTEELRHVSGQMDRNEATEYIFFVCFRNGFVAFPPRTGVVPAAKIEQLAEATTQSDAAVIRLVRKLVQEGYVRRSVPMNPYLMDHTKARGAKVYFSQAGSFRPSDNTPSCLDSCSSTAAGSFLQTFVIPFDSPTSSGFVAREAERARHPWTTTAIRIAVVVTLIVVVIVVLVTKSR